MTQFNSHPHIIFLLGVFCSGKESSEAEDVERGRRVRWAIVMDVHSGDLQNYISHRGALPEEESLRTLSGVFSALAHIHGLGVVHRDVKATTTDNNQNKRNKKRRNNSNNSNNESTANKNNS